MAQIGDIVQFAHGLITLDGTVVDTYGDRAVVEVPSMGSTVSVHQNDLIVKENA